MRYIEVKTEGKKKRVDLSAAALTIGRGPQNDVALAEERASRKHCVIEPVGGNCVVRDLDSTNGTRLNGVKISEAVLASGDELRIGATAIVYTDTEAPKKDARNRRARLQKGWGDDSASPLPFDEADGGQPLFTGEADDPPDAGDPGAQLAHFFKHGNASGVNQGDVSLLDARGDVVHDASAILADDDKSEGARTIRFFRTLLAAGMETRASDVHFEPQVSGGAVRIRIDGTMIDAMELDPALFGRTLNLVKVLGTIDITQRNIVQEAHFSAKLPTRIVDFRVSFTPAVHGQKLVIRILDSTTAPQHMRNLLLPDWMLNDITTVSKQTSGMVLVCGPTGSGKTTTLYAVLRDIDRTQRNVITIEDPVEYQIDNVTHIPTNDNAGNTFNTLLRSVLRQDPDVILLGEIRDKETAQTGMQAAMTGHLVLSTVHAKDTIGTIFRLLDLGVEPYLLGSSLNLVLGQRLVRLLCDNCKAGRRPLPSQIGLMGRHAEGLKHIYVPVGCPKCLTVGYVGRRALFELLTVNDSLRDAILNSPTIATIRDALRRTVFISLSEMGWQMVAEGRTSADEIERMVGGG